MNQSKVKDPRFWQRWRASGAVGSAATVAAVKAATPKAPKAPKAPAKPRVKAATPPETPKVFRPRDLGKDADPRWGIVDMSTDTVVETATSRTLARKRAKELTAA